jgi:hypothetical protein
LSKPSNFFEKAYDDGYHKGFDEGHDFGKRVAHNHTLAAALPDILNRYSRLQLRILNKPASYIRQELGKFQEDEVEKLKMELQDR